MISQGETGYLLFSFYLLNPFLPHSNRVSAGVINHNTLPALATGWEQYVQDRPLKFLPQGFLFWSRSRGLAFRSQTLERYEYKLLVPSSLPVLGEKACL